MNSNAGPVVWVIKEQMMRDEIGSVPVDYSPAMRYGEIRFITQFDFPMHPNSQIAATWIRDVAKFCAHYDDSSDYVICTGQPTAMFLVGYLLGLHKKIPRFLVWRRQENVYRPIEHLSALWATA